MDKNEHSWEFGFSLACYGLKSFLDREGVDHQNLSQIPEEDYIRYLTSLGEGCTFFKSNTYPAVVGDGVVGIFPTKQAALNKGYIAEYF